MLNRIFIVIICLSLATWISYVSYDLIRLDTSTNLRDCFSFEDELIVVAHNPKEINWEENNLEVLSINLAIYNSIVPKINYESSIFLSSKRSVILIERKENWIKKEVEAIFSKGLMPLKFQGKMNFTFGKHKGIFLKNQLILFQGRLIKNTHLRFDVDKKASYSLIFLSEKMIKTSDVYKKGKEILKYTKTKFSKTKINSIDDSKLFTGILPREFNTYSFFSTSYLKETDREFKKSDFSKWVDKGLVFISNKNQNAVVVFFK